MANLVGDNMSTLDNNGFVRDRYDQQRSKLVEKWLSYFPTATTDEESNNGRIISIQAELNDQADAKIQLVLNSFDPRSAVGNQLSNLAPLMNKRRRKAVRSSVILTLGADSGGATVPAGSIVAQANGPARFVTDNQVIIPPNGTRNVQAFANVYGPIIADAGTLTEIITPVFGWVTCTNASAASAGRDRDTDGILRANMLATSAAAVGTPEGIYTAVMAVAGVTYARIYENRDDTANALGMPPHSIFIIVEGGADHEIASALLAAVAYGIDYTDSSDIPTADWRAVGVQNPANLQSETIWFSRPVEKPIVVVVVGASDSDFPADGHELMRDAIIALVNSWDTGRTLYSSKLFVPANVVPGVDINSITINGTDRVEPATFEKISLSETNTTINVT